jgi:phosphonopyruvate decarboxylase
MIQPEHFVNWLEAAGVGFFAGVPDSLLADLCAYIEDRASSHVIAANEGAAVALAMGHHLATGGVGCVYLQNSGLGNCVNPLTSLVDPQVYGVPMLLVVGWRGEPGKSDEPQHVQMGAVTLAVLDAMGVPATVLPADEEEAQAAVRRALDDAKERRGAHAIVVKKGTFSAYRKAPTSDRYTLTREEAIAAVVAALPPDAVVVSTTGKPSRELYEIRVQRGEANDDLLTVGGMGHASQIALGVALAEPHRPVFCLDGDGAALMHMGSMAIIGTRASEQFRHVVLNNAAHESVGGQPTVAFDVDLCGVARACGYRAVARVESGEELSKKIADLLAAPGPAFLEIRVRCGSRKDLGRPTQSPAATKEAFMARLGRSR